MIHIALCHDDHYAPYASTVMASIMENNKESEICFHIVSLGINKEKKDILTKWIEEHHCEIRFYQVNADEFSKFPLGNKTYLNVGAYFRLYLGELLKDIDKVIYLDCDLVVNGSLVAMWETDIEDYAVAGVRDRINDYIHVYNRLRYPLAEGYINSGVMLINLKKWREQHFFEKAQALAQERPAALKNHDQDIINAIYHGQIKFLQFTFNLLEYYLYVEDWLDLDRKYYPEIIEACKKPTIVHFCMPQKPWHYECINPFKELYYKYRFMTPWPEVKLIHKTLKLSNKQRLKLFLEKIGLYKVERRKTLREDVNVIEEPNNILF